MKEKIFVYTPYSGSFYDKYLFNFVNNLNYKKIIVGSPFDLKIEFSENVNFIKFENLEYWSKSKDYKELDSVINFLDNCKIYRIHILRYSFENLFSIVKNHPKIHKFKISFGIFGHREILESSIRHNLFKNLIKTNCICSILVHSISKNHVPAGLSNYKKEIKVHFLSDPIYDDVDDYNFKNDVLENIEFLYFGTFYFGKGVDILIDAVDKVKTENYNLTIAGDASTANFNISELDFQKNINFINKYLTEKDVLNLFKKSNVVILPYRTTYENDTSGVLVQAALSNRLLIVPDIFPFNYVVNKYSLGVTFVPESSESLSKSIENMVFNYNSIYSRANFKNFISEITSWKEITVVI